MNTYLAQPALEKLEQAQAVIDQHLDGCLLCRMSKPCPERNEADATFVRYGRLPRRRPGVTIAQRTAGSWFTPSAQAARA